MQPTRRCSLSSSRAGTLERSGRAGAPGRDARADAAALPLPSPPQGKIKSLEQIYLFSLAVKEYQIVDYFLGSALKDEVRGSRLPLLHAGAAGPGGAGNRRQRRRRHEACHTGRRLWKLTAEMPCYSVHARAGADMRVTVPARPPALPQVMKIMPVQKQTRAGQRTRFKAFVVVGDYNGHVGLGVKCAKEVRARLGACARRASR